MENQNRELQNMLDALKLENEKLSRLVKEQKEALEAHEKGSLSREQTATLLQDLKSMEEKLTTAQKSKTFFKEQWGKAVKDIHRMKLEQHRNVELQIKSSKEELKNLE